MKFEFNGSKGGVFCSEYHIAPWPGFIFRRQAIVDMAKLLDKGKYIEIGMGAGVLTYEFQRLGFQASGYDLSAAARKTANEIFNSDEQRIEIKEELVRSDQGMYDCLGMFEVLEHIENDAEVLADYAKLLKKDGQVIISVPARMKHWGPLDVRSGHVRRYERFELDKLLDSSGFYDIDIINYGFPFTNLMMKVFAKVLHQKESEKLQQLSDMDKTMISGINRSPEFRFRKWIPYRLLVVLAKIQRLFYRNVDLGQGYVAIAKRK